jgi:hypothetical protein
MDPARPIPPAPLPTQAAAPRPIDAGWVQWIAENRLRDCTPESMLATMVAAGVDGPAAQQTIAAMETHPVFLAARRHQQLYRKLASVAANQQRLWELRSGYERVDKRSGVGPDEFLERYVLGCRPVVLTDVARDWPALQRWSPADLKARFGHLEVDVQAERAANPSYEQDKLKHRRSVRLADFVDQVLAGGATNDYYLTANNEVLRRPEFAPLLDDIGTLPAFCDAAQLARHSSFWFGPAGTITPLHHDTLMLLHTQVVGRKRWRFVSPLEMPRLYNHDGVFSAIDLERPDFVRHPTLREVKVLEVVLEPGDTVFLPLGWWHQVASLETSLSFSFSNMAFPNHFSYDNPSIRDW